MKNNHPARSKNEISWILTTLCCLLLTCLNAHGAKQFVTNQPFFELNSPISSPNDDISFNLLVKGINQGNPGSEITCKLYHKDTGKELSISTPRISGLESIPPDVMKISIELNPDAPLKIGRYEVRVSILAPNAALSGALYEFDRLGFDFIYDHPVIPDFNLSAALEEYSPVLFLGKRPEGHSNHWGYDDECNAEEQFYPIDIRDIPGLTRSASVNNVQRYLKMAIGRKTRGANEFGRGNWSALTANDGLGSFNAHTVGNSKNPFVYGTGYESSGKFLLDYPGIGDQPLANLYARDKGVWNNVATKIYGTGYRHPENSDIIFLQYYFYFPFDPKNNAGIVSANFARHVGDAEGIVVVLKKNNDSYKPEGVLYLHHRADQAFYWYGETPSTRDDSQTHSVEKAHLDRRSFRRGTDLNQSGSFDLGWNNTGGFAGVYLLWRDVCGYDNHPFVFNAQGSHGSFPRPGTYRVRLTGGQSAAPDKYQLIEYAGGKKGILYSTASATERLVVLPRLSSITTDSLFSFLLFSGAAGQTENASKDTLIPLPPFYQDYWYNIHSCFNISSSVSFKNQYVFRKGFGLGRWPHTYGDVMEADLPEELVATNPYKRFRWARDCIEYCSKVGIINPNRLHFNPERLVARKELASMVVSAADSLSAGTTLPSCSGGANFTDLGETNGIHPDVEEKIYRLACHGVVSSSNRRFRPHDTVSSGEAALMIVRGLRLHEKFGDPASVTTGTSLERFSASLSLLRNLHLEELHGENLAGGDPTQTVEYSRGARRAWIAKWIANGHRYLEQNQ